MRYTKVHGKAWKKFKCQDPGCTTTRVGFSACSSSGCPLYGAVMSSWTTIWNVQGRALIFPLPLTQSYNWLEDATGTTRPSKPYVIIFLKTDGASPLPYCIATTICSHHTSQALLLNRFPVMSHSRGQLWTGARVTCHRKNYKFGCLSTRSIFHWHGCPRVQKTSSPWQEMLFRSDCWYGQLYKYSYHI